MTSQLDAGAVERLRARLARACDPRFAFGLDPFATRIAALAERDGFGADPSGFVDRLVTDDLYLASACAAGDDRAWTELGARFFDFIRDFARRRLAEPAASDVADRTIADLWQRRTIGQYEGRSTLRTWLAAIVVQAAINAATQTRASAVRTEPLAAAGSERDARMRREAFVSTHASEQLSEWVSRAIDALPAEDRLLLLLYYDQELTLEQISPLARLSKAGLSRRLDRIRRDLRCRIDVYAACAGTSADEARSSVDLSQVELDLSTLLRSVKKEGPKLV